MFGNAKNQEAFYEAFAAHAAQSVEAARMVHEMLTDPTKATELAKQVGDAEHRGDKITHETIARLHKTWITPFDRSDIHLLISRLDDVLDSIEAAAERVVLFEISEVLPIAIDLAAVLIDGTIAVEKATKILPNYKQSDELLKLCVEINRLENKADGLYRRGIGAAFAPGNDPLMALKLRDIYDNLEAASDRCEDVANVLEGVVLEYA
jgi:predicted phosphate transport protein (TIGR00153 family)